MNPDRDFDRLLDQWFADGPLEVADRVIGQVADRIERQPQRPALRLPWRHVHVTTNLRWIAAAAVLVVAVFGGSRLLGTTPSPGAGAASPTPASLPSPSFSADPNVVRATWFAVPLTLTLSGGWTLGVARERYNLELFWGPGGSMDLGFHPLSKVTLPTGNDLFPSIPVPADFVGWVKGRPEFTAVQSRPVTLGGRAGTEVDAAFVWTAASIPHEYLRYATGAWNYNAGNAGFRVRFVIVPGPPGDGVIIVMDGPGADFDAAGAALDAVLATVHFDAPTPSPLN